MNKKSFLISVALMLVSFFVGIFFNSFYCPKVSVVNNNDTTKLCVDCDTSALCGIPFNDVRNMIAKYRDERFNVINTANQYPYNIYSEAGFQDSRALVFNVEDLMKYICKIEKLRKENNISSIAALKGLRFYFTVYPEQKPIESSYMSSIPPIYRKRHSVVIMPTYLNNLGQHVDFDPQYFNYATKMPLPIDSISGNVLAFDPNGGSCGNMNMLNHAGMCPPSCPDNNTTTSLFNIIDNTCLPFKPNTSTHIPCYRQ